jgi:hypothetical protein
MPVRNSAGRQPFRKDRSDRSIFRSILIKCPVESFGQIWVVVAVVVVVVVVVEELFSLLKYVLFVRKGNLTNRRNFERNRR